MIKSCRVLRDVSACEYSILVSQIMTNHCTVGLEILREAAEQQEEQSEELCRHAMFARKQGLQVHKSMGLCARKTRLHPTTKNVISTGMRAVEVEKGWQHAQVVVAMS